MADEGFKRKLTAILNADAVGYSRLMAEDEAATVKTMASYREIMSSLIKQHRGRVVDSPGDNVLADFSSVVDAVQCAVAVQHEFQTRNAELPENRRMEFRIGINLGDVIEEEDRLYGDGVNISARLEALADAGGVCISGTAFDQVKCKLSLGYRFVGEQTVKNIPDPVRVYKVLMDERDAGKLIGVGKKAPKGRWAEIAAIVVFVAIGLVIYQFYVRRPAIEPASVEKMAYPLPDKPSIAVLPFINISDDPKQEYLCDGLTEEIITALSKVRNMFVIARNSTFTYKGKAVKIQRVSEELGVRYVLEGSIQKSQDRLRINAQLIDAVTGTHLWAERYDRKMLDIFTVQDNVTKKILTALQVEIAEGEDARLWGKGTNNLEAYLKLLQARQLNKKHTKEDNSRAQQLIKEAIELDPQYAMAYRYLGATYVIEHMMSWSKFPEQSLKRAMEMAQKAIALDNTLAEAYALLGRIYLGKGQYEKAIAEGEKAYVLDPNSTHVLAALAYSLQYSGKPKEAIEYYQKAIRLDPIPPSWYTFGLGRAYRDSGQFEDAITIFKKLLHQHHHRIWAYVCLTATYSLAGRDEEAHALAAEALNIDPKLSAEYYINPLPYKDSAYKQSLIDALRNAGLPEHPPLQLPDKPSIAVLAFDSLSDDPEQEHFSDGISEEIINALSKTDKLFVIARNSSFVYKGKPVNVKQIARELGVRYVLEGSVRKSKDRVRITAQLIDATTGHHLWSERYDREMKDIFALQDEITKKIVTSLHVKLTKGEDARVISQDTNNHEAYLKYLEGARLFNHFKKDTNMRARQLFKEAIALDSNYVSAYGGLAWTHLMDAGYGWTASRAKSLEAASKIAQKALVLDDSNPTGYMALSSVLLQKGELNEAVALREKAVSLSPNSADAHFLLGNALLFEGGRTEEAIKEFKIANRLDPFPSNQILYYTGVAYRINGEYEKAIEFFKRAAERNPDHWLSYFGLTACYGLLGREEEARAAAAEVLRISPNFSINKVIIPYRDKADKKRNFEVLRKAGLPE